MIERYTLTSSPQQLADRFAMEAPEFYKPRYNAAPSQLLPVILLYSKGISFFYWGESPQWAKNKSIAEKWINVRAEQISEKPLLQRSLKKQRCLVLADGFYCWKKVGKKSMIPYRFALKTRAPFSIPGFWEEYEGDDGVVIHTFTLITIRADQALSSIAERTPVIFGKEKEQQWMDANATEQDLIGLLQPVPAELVDYYTVEPRISSMDADDKSLILPAPPSDQFGNLTLFD